MSMVDVLPAGDVPPGTMVRVEVEGQPICLANVNGTFQGVHDTCTHGMASLSVFPVEVRDGRVFIDPVPNIPHPFDTP